MIKLNWIELNDLYNIHLSVPQPPLSRCWHQTSATLSAAAPVVLDGVRFLSADDLTVGQLPLVFVVMEVSW